MSTVLGFPAATSPTPETGILWLTEGAGATRDKQVPAGTLVADLLPVVIAAASAPTALAGTETVPLLQSGDLKEMPISDVVVRYELDLSLITLKKYNNGVDATVASMDAGLSHVHICASPGGGFVSLSINLNLLGRSASASNNNLADIDYSGALGGLPSGLATSLGGPSIDFLASGLIGSNHYTARAAVVMSAGGGNINLRKVPSGNNWQDLAGTNNEPLELAGTIQFHPVPAP